MDADDRENVRMFFGQCDRAQAALDGRADRDDAADAGFSRASQHIIEVRREIRVVEMGVGFDQHCRLKIADFRLAAGSICDRQSEFCNRYHSTTVLAQVSPPPKTTIRT